MILISSELKQKPSLLVRPVSGDARSGTSAAERNLLKVWCDAAMHEMAAG